MRITQNGNTTQFMVSHHAKNKTAVQLRVSLTAFQLKTLTLAQRKEAVVEKAKEALDELRKALG